MFHLLCLFLMGMLTDITWVKCIRASAQGKALATSLWTMALTTIGILSSWWIIAGQDVAGLLAVVLGGGVGSFITVKWFKERK